MLERGKCGGRRVDGEVTACCKDLVVVRGVLLLVIAFVVQQIDRALHRERFVELRIHHEKGVAFVEVDVSLQVFHHLSLHSIVSQLLEMRSRIVERRVICRLSFVL